MDSKRILILDDETTVTQSLAEYLSGLGFEAKELNNPLVVKKVVQEFCPDLLLLDVSMPDLDGIGVMRELKEVDPNLPIIIISALGSGDDAADAMDLGAINYVSKPFDLVLIKKLIFDTLELDREE
jgi:DNA-binding NtrC family response regulator